MHDRIFAIPVRVLASLTLPDTIRASDEKVLQMHDGFYTRVVPLIGDDMDINAFLNTNAIRHCDNVIEDDAIYHVATRMVERLGTITHEKKGDELPASEANTAIPRRAAQALGRLADLTGLRCHMHFHRGPMANLVTDGDENDLHFIMGASPPGDSCKLQRTDILGVRLDPKGRWATYHGPARGRGNILKDAAGMSTAQIIERTVYLFAPAIDLETAPLFSEEGGDLIWKLVALVSKALAEGTEDEREEIPIGTPDAFVGFIKKAANNAVERIEELITESDTKAKDALSDYHDALNAKRRYITFRAALAALYDSDIEAHTASDWDRLTAHTLIDRMQAFENRLVITTKRIIASDAGAQYDLGAFVIQIVLGRSVVIWTESPTHPGGIAHPHISKQDIICFGNAGIEIERSVHELRIADTVELVLEWLAGGYDETLATHKIEEWPLYKETA